jgi:hypothetical protein
MLIVRAFRPAQEKLANVFHRRIAICRHPKLRRRQVTMKEQHQYHGNDERLLSQEFLLFPKPNARTGMPTCSRNDSAAAPWRLGSGLYGRPLGSYKVVNT